MGVPSTASCSALLAERNESKSSCTALMLGNQCITELAEEAKELRAMVVDIEKSNASVQSTSTKRQSRKELTVAKQVLTRLRRS